MSAFENDVGAGPATTEPPSDSAVHDDGGCDFNEANMGAEIEIEAAYRRKLAGIRMMPRFQRAGARREARDWRRIAFRILREQRRNENFSRKLRRASQRTLSFRQLRPDK